MSDYIDGDAVCPYYGAAKRRKDGRPVLTCEDGTRISFPDRCAFAGFVEGFCGSPEGWRSCCIAKMRDDYYERLDAKRRRRGR